MTLTASTVDQADAQHEARTEPTPLDQVPLERLENQITELAAHLNAAECRWLLLVAEYDRREGWATWECRSAAHWLNWKCGIDFRTARDRVRVARRLTELSKITAAFASGELSYSKVRALTRVAEPETEGALLEMARAGTASHLERIVRAYRRALDHEELDDVNRIHERRSLDWLFEDDGTFVLRARLTPEQGACVRKALEMALEREEGGSAEPPPAVLDDRPSIAQRRADALVTVAESYLGTPEVSAGSGDRHLVTVHVDAEVLALGGEGRCELDDGPALVAETARRLACDAPLVGIVEDDEGTPLDVGRKTRTISPALRRALAARDQGCRFPGCTSRRFVDGHHIQHWAKGGATSLANLLTLCKVHHRSVHEGGYQVEVAGAGNDTSVVFRRPDGVVVPSAPPALPQGCAHAVARQNRELGLDIGPRTAQPGWAGEHLDLDLALTALFSRRSSPSTGAPANCRSTSEAPPPM